MNANNDYRRLYDAIAAGRIEDVERFFQPNNNNDDERAIIVQPDEAIWGDCYSALHLACCYRHLDVVRVLVERVGVNVNALALNTGESALHMACQHGTLAIVEYLLEGDCGFRWDVNHTNSVGQTALHNASLRSHYNVVYYLVKQHGAHVEASSVNGDTPLHLVCRSSWWHQRRLPIAQFLVKEGHANVETKNSKDETALHAASECNDNVSLVQYLVEECGANIEATTSQGETPLYKASYSGCYEVVQYLLEKGANVHATSTNNTGRTVLHAALGRPNPLSIGLRLKTLLLLLKYY